MEVRSVSVHLDADVASYIANMRLAGAETDKAFGHSSANIASVNTRLQTTEKTLTGVDKSAKQLGSDMDSTTKKVDNGSKAIDKYSGRLGVFADLALGLGPALVPVFAEAVPLAAAFGTNLIAAGAAFGVIKLGTLGVGDALKAVDKAAILPTAANLQAAHVALQALPPEARAFVFELQAMRPLVNDLRNAAAGGLLPGVGQGLAELKGDLPIIERGIRGVSTELGSLAADAGHSLASDRWQPFLRFVGTEAPRDLEVMGHSLGNVAHGAAELVMAFHPLTTDINAGILRLTEDFDRWATSLGRTKGFQDFLDYLQANGPRVLDLLGTTATTLTDIVKAAAPLGGPVLTELTDLLKVIDAIVNSPIGTPLLLGITAFRLFTRAEQAWSAVSQGAIGKFIAGQREAVRAITLTTSAQERATLSASQMAQRQAATSAGWRTLGGGVLKTGVAIAGLAAISSGLTEKLHLTNTATLTLAGSLAGPEGAALGVAAGLLLDFAFAQHKSVVDTQQLTDTLNQQTGAITQNTRAYVAQQLQQSGVYDAARQIGLSLQDVTAAALGNQAALRRVTDESVAYQDSIKGNADKESAFSENAIKVKSAIDDTRGAIHSGSNAISEIGEAMGRASAGIGHLTGNFHIAQNAAAAFTAEVEHTNRVLTGRQDLRDYQQALDDLTAAFKKNGHTLDINTQKGRDNQAALDHIAQTATAVAQTLKGSDRQHFLQQARQDFIDAAVKLGKSREAARALADQLGLLNRTSSAPTIALKGIPESLHQLDLVYAYLARLRSKTIDITLVRHTGGKALPGSAEGGTVPGPRAPYGDKVLVPLAPGEEVISNRYGQADRNRPLLRRINARGMADGGTFNPANTFVSGFGLGSAADGATSALHGLKAESASLTKQYQSERQQHQNLIQQRQQLASTVRSNFTSDLFAMSSVWGAPQDPRAVLRGDIRNAREYRQDIERLRGRGLSRGVLSTIDTLQEAQVASGFSRREDREISRLYAERQRAARAAGSTLGGIVDNKRLAQMDAHLEVLHHDLKGVQAAIKRHQAETKKSAAATGKSVASNINKPVGKAARVARR